MKDLDDHYDPEKVESTAREKWSNNDTYQKVKNSNRDNDTFYFLDGPPFTSGRMHCGTAWGKVLKDVFLRYYRMQGYNVVARPGYDTHGLPIEVKVEEKNGFESKQEIEEYGMERFIKECQEYVYEQKSVMDEEFQDLGVWMDWNNPYLTMNKQYMETVWSAFSRLYEDGLVSRGFDVLNTCPRCETTLSDSELEYDHRTVEAAYVGFDLDDGTTLVTWTTTPWTVVGHQFVAVDKDGTYSKVETESDTYVVAESCVQNVMDTFGVTSYSVVEKLDGEELVGHQYKHPLSEYVDGLPRDRYVVQHADYVEDEKTGLVHSAPGFGHEDYERGSDLDYHPFSPVGVDGKFTEDAGKHFHDKYVHSEGRSEALSVLSNVGSLLATETYTHEYPHCPRCDTDVVFRATKQWMVEVTSMKDDLNSAIDDTEWFPAEAREERFRNTVENAPNWNISRQRYWGTPLPVWVCEECGSDTVVRSAENLQHLSRDLQEPPEDLHRPSVDDVSVECHNCGGDSHRVPDVLDVWFDSSVASWASLGVNPYENPKPDSWPSNLVIEGHDQTRGWFLMQLYMGVALSDRAPYEDVLMHGFALLDGKPMSKSRGHVLRPPEVIEEHGRDALRAYMLSNEQQENDVNMTSDMQGVFNMKQKLDIVWNVYRFALLYMNEDEYEISRDLETDASDRTTLDNWVLSRLDQTMDTATNAFENRRPHNAFLSTLNFLINDVSRYYVKSIRDRVWVEEDTTDKMCAYDTLGTVLLECSKMLSPFVPHLSDQLYSSLNLEDPEDTVHLEDWSEPYGNRDTDLESSVSYVRDVENAVAKARDKIGRRQRWALKNVFVETNDEELQEALNTHQSLLKQRSNVNSLSVGSSYRDRRYVVEPDMSVFGPKYKQDADSVAEKVRGMAYSQLPLEVDVDGSSHKITEQQVNKRSELPDNIVNVESDGFAVYVDTELTDSIVQSGLVRDLVRRAQEMRDELDLDMQDYVQMSIETESETLKKAFESNMEYISTEVRVDKFETSSDLYEKEWTVDDHSVLIRMGKVENQS